MKRPYASLTLAICGLSLVLLPARGLSAAGFSYAKIAQLGMKAPDGTGTMVNDFEISRLSAAGEVAFLTDYQPVGADSGDDSEALFLGSQGSLIEVAHPGLPAAGGWSFAPGGPNGSMIGQVGMNTAVDLAFGSDIQKPGDSTVRAGTFVWHHQTNQITPVHLPGDSAPGGGVLGSSSHTSLGLNDQGDVAFSAEVADSLANTDKNINGVFLRTADGQLHVVARPGSMAPDGSTFTNAARPTLSNSGTVAFQATTEKSTTNGVYLVIPGQPILAIGTTDTPAPGGSQFSEAKLPHLNNSDAVIFNGHTDAGWGLYRWQDKKLTALLAPGADLRDNNTLDQTASGEGSCALANSGDAAAMVKLASDSSTAVYLIHNDQPVMVAKDGMDLPGIGKIDSIDDGYVAVGSASQVAFAADLADGTTVLVLATSNP